MRTTSVIPGLLCLGLLGCGGDPGPTGQNVDPSTEIVAGTRVLRTGTTWGGQHAGLTVTATGGTLSYDCAHGAITQRIPIDDKGTFDVTGYHVFDHGGPSMPGETEVQHPAHYTGTSDGKTMTFSLTTTDTAQTVGPFTLTFGGTPLVYKCL